MRMSAILCAALLVIACGSKVAPAPTAKAPDTTKPAVAEVSFARDVQSLVAANCMPCHSGPNPKGGYDQTTYAGIMGNGSDTRPNVVPGKPDSSLLYQKLRDGKMPPSGKLDSAKIALIYKWISEGARNN